jgi:hypothetical protein
MHTLHQYLALFHDTLCIRHPGVGVLWMVLPCVLYVAGWQVRKRRVALGKLEGAGSGDLHAVPGESSVKSLSTSANPRPFDLSLAMLLLMAGVAPVLFSLTLLTQSRINSSNVAQLVGIFGVVRNYDTACREDPARGSLSCFPCPRCLR